MNLLRLTAATEALAGFLLLFPATVASRRLPPAAAVGRVLAESLVAAAPVPAGPAALRDGWAVAAADTQGSSAYAPSPLPGMPAFVTSGTPLPPGCDAVLSDFDVAIDGPFAAALQPAAPGDGARLAGEEIAAGTLLRPAGERLRPHDLPALAGCGITTLTVRVPRLGWIATGDDMLADGGRDTLGAMMALLATADGAELDRLAPVPDDPVAIAAALRAAAGGHDLILLGGGTGEGPDDRSAAALATAGQLDLHGIGMRPGMTAGFGMVTGTPVLLMPGGAADALAAWQFLARPALRRLTGTFEPPPWEARLTRKVTSTVGLLELVAVRLLNDGRAEPLAVGDWPLAVLAAAEAGCIIPAASEGQEAGAPIALFAL